MKGALFYGTSGVRLSDSLCGISQENIEMGSGEVMGELADGLARALTMRVNAGNYHRIDRELR